jgi:hypothetical protein
MASAPRVSRYSDESTEYHIVIHFIGDEARPDARARPDIDTILPHRHEDAAIDVNISKKLDAQYNIYRC